MKDTACKTYPRVCIKGTKQVLVVVVVFKYN